MAWKRRQTSRLASDPDSTLGAHFHAAVNKAESMATVVIAKQCTPTFGGKDALSWIFPATVLDALRTAVQYSHKDTSSMSYRITDDCKLLIEFAKLDTLVPRERHMKIDLQAANPLINLIAEARRIHHLFATVTHVTQWMDKHCTPGAMRYYWPTILSLAPDSPVLSGEMPRRHTVPKENIAPLLPLLRESATTVAMALLTDDNRKGSWERTYSLLFDAGEFMHPDTGAMIKTPQRGYDFHI